jgi:acyl carrier protein
MIDTTVLREKIASLLRQPVAKITDDCMLSDLVTQSFVLVEMIIEMQEDLGIRLVQDDLRDVRTVGDLIRMLERQSAR